MTTTTLPAWHDLPGLLTALHTLGQTDLATRLQRSGERLEALLANEADDAPDHAQELTRFAALKAHAFTLLEGRPLLPMEDNDAQAGEASDQTMTPCANCGKPWSQAKEHRTAQMYDGEWVCSKACEDEHDELGCPFAHGENYRTQFELREGLLNEGALARLSLEAQNARDQIEGSTLRTRHAASGILGLLITTLDDISRGVLPLLNDLPKDHR